MLSCRFQRLSVPKASSRACRAITPNQGSYLFAYSSNFQDPTFYTILSGPQIRTPNSFKLTRLDGCQLSLTTSTKPPGSDQELRITLLRDAGRGVTRSAASADLEEVAGVPSWEGESLGAPLWLAGRWQVHRSRKGCRTEHRHGSRGAPSQKGKGASSQVTGNWWGGTSREGKSQSRQR